MPLGSFLPCSVPSVFLQPPRAVVQPVLRVISGIVGMAALGLGAMSAQAIPQADAVRKLEAVAVYVLLNAEDQPAFVVDQESPDQLVLPMFMQAEQARQAQKTLEESSNTTGSRVVPLPLNEAFARNEKLVQEIQAHNENASLVTPLVPAQEDWQKAEEILLAQGIAQEEIKQNLIVPVFFTDPPISFTPPGADEAQIALFFNYSQLQEAKRAVPDFDGEDKVMDWRRALNILIEEEEDRYFFFPTEDTLRIVQEQQQAVQQQQAAQEQQADQEGQVPTGGEPVDGITEQQADQEGQVLTGEEPVDGITEQQADQEQQEGQG